MFAIPLAFDHGLRPQNWQFSQHTFFAVIYIHTRILIFIHKVAPRNSCKNQSFFACKIFRFVIPLICSWNSFRLSLILKPISVIILNNFPCASKCICIPFHSLIQIIVLFYWINTTISYCFSCLLFTQKAYSNHLLHNADNYLHFYNEAFVSLLYLNFLISVPIFPDFYLLHI